MPSLFLVHVTDSGRLVTNELKHVSRAIAVDNLTAIVSNLAEIRQNLANIEQDTGLLQDKANQLQVSSLSAFFVCDKEKETGTNCHVSNLIVFVCVCVLYL